MLVGHPVKNVSLMPSPFAIAMPLRDNEKAHDYLLSGRGIPLNIR